MILGSVSLYKISPSFGYAQYDTKKRNYKITKSQDSFSTNDKDLLSLIEKCKNPFFVQKVINAIINDSKENDKDIKNCLLLLKNPKSTIKLFTAVKNQIENQENGYADEINDFYLAQLNLSIKNLASIGASNISFAANKKPMTKENIFEVCTEGLPFCAYFPIGKYNMVKAQFNEKLFNILMDKNKREELIEVINNDLSRKGYSNQLNTYLKEKNPDNTINLHQQLWD